MIIIPPDPVPIQNPRQEYYVSDDNPLSPIGQSALPTQPTGTNIGNLTGGGGTYAAFDSNANKPFSFSANLTISVSSFQNTVGKNWGADVSGITVPSSLSPPSHSHVAASFTAYAPNDVPFLNTGATGYYFQGSSDGATWTNLSSGTTAGTIGEILTVTSLTGNSYQYHRFVLQGDGVSTVGVAQLSINVSDVAMTT